MSPPRCPRTQYLVPELLKRLLVRNQCARVEEQVEYSGYQCTRIEEQVEDLGYQCTRVEEQVEELEW